MKHYTHTSRLVRHLSWSLPSAAVLSLAACGGGDGGGDSLPTTPSPPPAQPSPPPAQTSLDSTQVQGRWVSSTGASPALIANVVPIDANSAYAWVLSTSGNDAVRMHKLRLTKDFSVTGKAYDLQQTSAPAQAVSGTSSLSTTPKSLTIDGLPTGKMALVPNTTAPDAGNQADATGTWSTTVGSAILVQWTLGADGLLNGTSSAGCIYSGKLTAQPTLQVFDAQVTESCLGTPAVFNGIATVSADKKAMKFLATTADETRGVALLLAK